MNIKTEYHVGGCVWSAVDDDTYEAGMTVGTGFTEKEAIADLLEKTADIKQKLEDK